MKNKKAGTIAGYRLEDGTEVFFTMRDDGEADLTYPKYSRNTALVPTIFLESFREAEAAAKEWRDTERAKWRIEYSERGSFKCVDIDGPKQDGVPISVRYSGKWVDWHLAIIPDWVRARAEALWKDRQAKNGDTIEKLEENQFRDKGGRLWELELLKHGEVRAVCGSLSMCTSPGAGGDAEIEIAAYAYRDLIASRRPSHVPEALVKEARRVVVESARLGFSHPLVSVDLDNEDDYDSLSTRKLYRVTFEEVES